MLFLLLLFLIVPQDGFSGIELNPSDPLGTNDVLMKTCAVYTGQCNVWYPTGRFNIFKTIHLPLGVKNVYFKKDTILIPCFSNSKALFTYEPSHERQYPSSPKFLYEDGTVVDWAKTVNQTSACGEFIPPLRVFVLYW